MTLFCNICKKNIAKSLLKMYCNICNDYFHTTCAGLTEVEAKVLLKQKKSWTCGKCIIPCEKTNPKPTSSSKNVSKPKVPKENEGSSKKDQECDLNLAELIKVMKEMKMEICEMKNSLDYMNDLFETERVRTQVLSEIVEEIRIENSSLKKDLSYMSKFINDMEYQKIKNNVVITGIHGNNGKDDLNCLKEKALLVLHTIDQTVKKEHIKDIRLQKTKSERGLVIVSLENEEKKTKMLKQRKMVGLLTGEKCKIPGAKNIYVNEELTATTHNLLREAGKLKNVGYRFVWCRNGCVYARVNEGDVPRKVFSAYHLREMLESSKQGQ